MSGGRATQPARAERATSRPLPNRSAGAARPGRRLPRARRTPGSGARCSTGRSTAATAAPASPSPRAPGTAPAPTAAATPSWEGGGCRPAAARRQTSAPRVTAPTRPRDPGGAGRGGGRRVVRPPASPGAPWPPASRRRSSSSSPGSARSGVPAQPCEAVRSPLCSSGLGGGVCGGSGAEASSLAASRVPERLGTRFGAPFAAHVPL